MAQTVKILIVEDEVIVAMSLKKTLEQFGYQVSGFCHNAKQALQFLKENSVDITLLDINLSGKLDGIDVGEYIHTNCESKFIYTTAYSSDEIIQRAKKTLPFGYLVKPIQEKELKIAVEMAIYAAKLEKERDLIHQELENKNEELSRIHSSLELLVDEKSQKLEETNQTLKEEIHQKEKISLLLDESEQKYRTMMESLTDYVYICDKNRKLLYLNPAFIEVLGYDATGASCHKSLFGYDSPCEKCSWEQIKEGKSPVTERYHEGLKQYFHITNTPLKTKEGGVVKMSVLRNITYIKSIENKLLLSKKSAEDASIAKSTFLANISHELRNPMHHILSFSQFGMKRFESVDLKKLHNYFETIFNSGCRLLVLLDDLLDLSKMEAGKMNYSFSVSDIHSIVNDSTIEMVQTLKDKQLTLEIIKPEFQTILNCDIYKIGQVIRNILSNAIRYSDNGKKITVHFEESAFHRNNLYIRAIEVHIRDQGVGIPEEELEDIFDKFVQSSKTDSGAGGTGLGLAICLEVIKKHKGEIWAKNHPEGGTIFSFKIPTDLKM